MANILIDKELCIACGFCVKDCSRNAIEIVDNLAEVDLSLCNECGHCLAVCPQGAVLMPEYEDKILAYEEETFSIEPENLLNFIKFRRSIRQFEKKDLEAEKILALIEAGQHSPTAGNRQNNQYMVIKDKLKQIKEIAIKTLYDMALDKDLDLKGSESYRQAWIRLYEDYTSNKKDGLFFDAPVVLALVGNKSDGFARVNGSLASARMELLAYSLGLGACYIGFFQIAMAYNPELKKLLDLKEEEDFILCYALGYPDVSYKRTVPRKPAKVRFY